jgi:hypothetical protein
VHLPGDPSVVTGEPGKRTHVYTDLLVDEVDILTYYFVKQFFGPLTHTDGAPSCFLTVYYLVPYKKQMLSGEDLNVCPMTS